MNSPSCKSSTAKKRTKREQRYILAPSFSYRDAISYASAASIFVSPCPSIEEMPCFLIAADIPTNQGHLPFTNTRASQSDDGLDSSHNHSNINTQSSDVMEHVTFLSAKRAHLAETPRANLDKKMFEISVATDLNFLALPPTFHFN